MALPTSNTPVKNNGEKSENFSTARRETEIMLNACLKKSKVSSLFLFFQSIKIQKQINNFACI